MKPSLFVRILCHKKIFTKAGHDRKTTPRLNPHNPYRIMDISYCWTYQLMGNKGDLPIARTRDSTNAPWGTGPRHGPPAG